MKNKVLIAEDEPYVSRILKLALQQEGYEVSCATNGIKAFDEYQATHPGLVITDVKMPKMTGQELVESIRALSSHSEAPVIVMTSTLESENRDWVGDVGNVTFLGKPVSPRELVSVVNEYFALSNAP